MGTEHGPGGGRDAPRAARWRAGVRGPRPRPRGAVELLSGPFDERRKRFLDEVVRVRRRKAGSEESGKRPLLHAAGQRGGRPSSRGHGHCWRSGRGTGLLGSAATGEAAESQAALATILSRDEAWPLLPDRVTLLHCTSEYSSAIEEGELRARATLREAFRLPVGLSDHTFGATLAVMAVALGATAIETHITLHGTMPGREHAASRELKGFRAIVTALRKRPWGMGGRPSPHGTGEQAMVRSSLVTTGTSSAGQILTPEDPSALRPTGRISLMAIWDRFGRPSPRDYQEGGRFP